MSGVLARLAMVMATRCLGERRRDWADAMSVEFDEALVDGRALPFAAGCLVTAWRELPADREGRLTLARHALALGMLVPIAAVLLAVALTGATGVGHPVNDGNRATAPVLMQLIAAIAIMRLPVAVAMLDADWARVAALHRLGAAAVIASGVLAGLALLDMACVVLPAACLLSEWLALRALRGLHGTGADDVLA